MRIDNDSKVVWKLERNTHHDVTVGDDGNLWVPAHYYRPDGLPDSPGFRPWFYEDVVLKVSPDGRVLDEISVLGALKDFQGVLTVTYGPPRAVWEDDPLHLNSVEPLPVAWADRYPGLKAGDLLVFLRNNNMLAVIDPETRKAKRFHTGPFVQQHDGDYMANGNLMVYDNWGGDRTCGGTRVLELEPASMRTVWSYDGCPDGGFLSGTRGVQEVLENGNVLTVDPKGGRAMEVTHDADPKLVWEYYNIIGSKDGAPQVGMLMHASRFREDQLDFLR